ncbi:ATP phosphoribosyltransferase regulatory subunit [Sporosarcina pasteurii]|uniref:ATP phosphoribosyltransferase regulatory subunit n=1 Tax=Sporosarcina pasteurii TaxID=1474 RepID=A0A380C9F8_SPOPA|nr:ATP phosphoribosyltransferase regulatory subunit [Sporosarcina pasteurii]MDS9473031.1 ATP phosphoribosyltransferase regulatory subunit [Sporosarcina pasteurii]QBQ04540.1 ATP phosphoribosyltransferase regulatory subunit [Sporosarcina pasteurii]SUJ14194.1 ATP phosphoribosyltransferase regulatory subunit [Sporosarcina pasteurii]
MYTDYNANDEIVKDYQKYERMIKTINKRFKTYGYERIKTPTFEQYDMYAQVTSSINRKEMVKTIDGDGEVLVLRPDVTIPITKQLADNYTTLPHELRYYYVQDVYRQSQLEDEEVERTQAGVEYFCDSTPEADAEVIALACHTLKDLGFRNIKIELGHAGFFQELIEKGSFTERQLMQLKNLIQTKNIVEIEPFLQRLDIAEDLIAAFVKIPLLYGDPVKISERARDITKTVKMEGTLDYLLEVYDILRLYGLEDNIVMDLGLINRMGYYSDIIFQGFVEKFGRPVLMGGRYNYLGNEFGAALPAIGFACTVESLMKAAKTDLTTRRTPVDVKISYDENSLKESIVLANELRERNYTVISNPANKEMVDAQPSIYQIIMTQNEQVFVYNEVSYYFDSIQALLKLMNGAKGAVMN